MQAPPRGSLRRSRITVDLGAIRRNAERLREAAAPAELWAVVKADAYGHGAVGASRAALAGGASALCVATVREGEELREAFPSARILVMGPLAPLRGGGGARRAGSRSRSRRRSSRTGSPSTSRSTPAWAAGACPSRRR